MTIMKTKDVHTCLLHYSLTTSHFQLLTTSRLLSSWAILSLTFWLLSWTMILLLVPHSSNSFLFHFWTFIFDHDPHSQFMQFCPSCWFPPPHWSTEPSWLSPSLTALTGTHSATTLCMGKDSCLGASSNGASSIRSPGCRRKSWTRESMGVNLTGEL